MELVQRRSGKVVILDIHGTISMGESKEKFVKVMNELLLESDVNVLINFSGVDDVDSTGIGELIGYLNKFVEGERQFKILKPQERVRKLLRITKLDSIFQIFDDEDEALKSFA